MYRTDKQFMTNPATAGSRIYIGGLAKTTVASDLEEKFQVHGKILGLVLQMGFAFIQFEHENQAQSAIRSESNTMLHGRKITVKQAVDKSKGNPNQGNRRQNFGQNAPNFERNNQNFERNAPNFERNNQNFQRNAPNFERNAPNFRQNNQNAPPPQAHEEPQTPAQPFPNRMEESPKQMQKVEPENESAQEEQPPTTPSKNINNSPMGPKNAPPGPGNDELPPKNEGPPLRNDGPPPRNDGPPPRNDGPPTRNDVPPLRNDGPPMRNDGPLDKRSRKRRVRSRDRFQPNIDPYRDDYYGREDYPPPVPVPYNNRPPAPVLDQPDRNDCEIIVVSKPLTKYAEYVEQRLKSLGLIVDLLFPNEDVPIGRVLANISSRGCLYAILIMPQNEEHRSLTLNVLHGITQEHRNMPIEDALVLITRNFESYMRGDKSALETPGQGGEMTISDRHPTAMQLLLNLLAENRQITSAQYDKLLKYLQDRKELQHQHEIAEGADQESQESNSKQAELQSRIMNILNKAGTDVPPPPPPETSQSSDVAPPLLKDPSVQKALDSLLGGDMFKSMGVAL